MKTSKPSIILFSLFLIFSLSSCTTKLNFLNSNVVPAATGYVKVTKDNNNNYALNLKVTNLADPSRLQPKKDFYVVWLVTKNNITKNIGQLKSSSGFFSSLLVGELNAVSTFEPDYVYITAEDNANILKPNGNTILTTKK